MFFRFVPVSGEKQNIFGLIPRTDKSLIGCFGLPCLPAGRPSYRQAGRQAGVFGTKSEENKVTRVISDVRKKEYLIIRYFASRQKRQEYNLQQIDIWAFRSSLPAGRQASSVFCPTKERK